ncbi:hypothetical protein SCUP234_10590 [Seiridium cupressi]
MSDKSPPEHGDEVLIYSVYELLLADVGQIKGIEWAAAEKMCNGGRLSKTLLQRRLQDFRSLYVDHFHNLLENQPGGQQAAFDRAKNDQVTALKLGHTNSFDVFKPLLTTAPFFTWADEQRLGLFAFIGGIGLPKTILSAKAGQALWNYLPPQNLCVVASLQCGEGPLSDPLQMVLSLVWIILREPGVTAQVRRRPAIILNILAATTLEEIWPYFVGLVDLMNTFILILDNLQNCDGDSELLLQKIDFLANRLRLPGWSKKRRAAVVKVIATSLSHDSFEFLSHPAILYEYKMLDLQKALEGYFESRDTSLSCAGWQITAPALEAASNLGGGSLVLRTLMGPAHIKRSPEELGKFLQAVLSSEKLKSLPIQHATFKDTREPNVTAAILLVLVENTEPLTAEQIHEQILLTDRSDTPVAVKRIEMASRKTIGHYELAPNAHPPIFCPRLLLSRAALHTLVTMPPIVTRLEFPRSHDFVRFLAQVLWEADEQTFTEACAEAEAIYRKDGVTSTMLCAVMSLPVLDESETLALLQTQPTFEQAVSDADSDWQAIYEQATALSAKSGYFAASISTSGSSNPYHSWLCSSTSSMLCALESQATEQLRVSAAVLADVFKDGSTHDDKSGNVLAVSLCRTPRPWQSCDH